MAKKQDRFELTPRQKTTLLKLGLEAATPNTAREEYREDLLYDVLKHPLPIEASTISMLPAPLRGLSRRISSIAGGSLVEQITSPDADISTIERIKEYAKRSGKLAKSTEHTDVLLAIYYATIANGLVFHGRRMTRHSWGHLVEAFRSLATKSWMHEELADLLEQAQRYSEDQVGRVDWSNGP